VADIITLVPDDAELWQIAHQAAASGLQLIDNGKRWALAHDVPAGWQAIPLNTDFLTRSAA